MIHVAITLPDDVGATLEGRARDEGFADLSDYLRALAEAEAEGSATWEPTPEVAAALSEAAVSGDSPHTFDEIIANAKRKAGLRRG
jgi:hypothetical protein